MASSQALTEQEQYSELRLLDVHGGVKVPDDRGDRYTKTGRGSTELQGAQALH